jgi:hypothetical protein
MDAERERVNARVRQKMEEHLYDIRFSILMRRYVPAKKRWSALRWVHFRLVFAVRALP